MLSSMDSKRTDPLDDKMPSWKKQPQIPLPCASPAIFVVFVFGPSGPESRRKRPLTWSSASDVNLFSTKKDDSDAISAHRSARRDREEPCYAARFNLTTGRCRRFSWKLTTISNRWPGFPAMSVWGLAQGAPRRKRPPKPGLTALLS